VHPFDSIHALAFSTEIMAKDKSEKKSKKSKEVTETVTETVVTGEDVDMADIEVAKVRV
jgi:hypothetical protein